MEHSIAQAALIPRKIEDAVSGIDNSIDFEGDSFYVISFENEGHDDQGYYPTEVELKEYFERAERPRDDIVVEGRPLYIEME